MPIPREKGGLLMIGYTPKTLVFSSLELESVTSVFVIWYANRVVDKYSCAPVHIHAQTIVDARNAAPEAEWT